MTVTKAEPRFDIDLHYGFEAERNLREFFDWIAEGSSQVECKRKRIIDLELYVETHCDKGRRGDYQPSGITTTTAQAWSFTVGASGISILIPTDLLRASLAHPSVQDKAETDGACPTRGKLVHLRALFDTHTRMRDKLATATVDATAPIDLAALRIEIFGE